MPTLRTIAAVLTIALGGVLAFLLAGVEFSHADGDGGIASPGLVLALVMSGAPILTGIEALRRQVAEREGQDGPKARRG